jgi:hypothetical protein
MEKTSSQPLQQPNKPKSTTQTQNKTKKPNAYRTCAHKASTTTKTKNTEKNQQSQKLLHLRKLNVLLMKHFPNKSD